MATLEFRPLTDFRLGAQVVGLDIREAIASDTAEVLRRALDDYGVLLIRDQPLTPAQQATFARIFGDLDPGASRFNKPGEEAHYISNAMEGDKPKDRGIGLGNGDLDIHMDQLFFETPNAACTLHGLEVPSRGGETIFATTEPIYNELPSEMRESFASLKALHFLDAGYVGGNVQGERTRITKTVNWPWKMKVEELPAETPRWVHPILFTNPRTGRKVVWLATIHTLCAMGISRAESDDLLGRFFERLHTTQYRYTHSWKVGDTVLWSNRNVHHGRTPFDPSETRTLQRVPICSPMP